MLARVSRSAVARRAAPQALSSVTALRGTCIRRPSPLASGNNRARNFANLVVEAKKGDSVKKRARQAEKRRLYNRARKSACKTRIKNVVACTEELKEKGVKGEEELAPVDALIALAYKEIDRAVSKGVFHKKTAARKKAKVASVRRELAISAGLYTP